MKLPNEAAWNARRWYRREYRVPANETMQPGFGIMFNCTYNVEEETLEFESEQDELMFILKWL